MTKLGQPLAVSTEVFVSQRLRLPRCRKKRSKPSTTPARWLTTKKTKANNRRIADVRPIIVLLMAWCLSMGAYAATAPDAKQITQELEQAKAQNPSSRRPLSHPVRTERA